MRNATPSGIPAIRAPKHVDATPLLTPPCDDPTCKGCNPSPQQIAECGLLLPNAQSAAWEEPNPFADLDRSPTTQGETS